MFLHNLRKLKTLQFVLYLAKFACMEFERLEEHILKSFITHFANLPYANFVLQSFQTNCKLCICKLCIVQFDNSTIAAEIVLPALV